MKMQPLIDKLLNKWPTKVFCIVIALLLYFFYNISQLGTKTLSVDVDVVSNGQMMVVSSYQKHVKVTVRANPQDLAAISSKDITAQLNINQYTKSGEYTVPVMLDFVPEVLLIDPFEVRVSPDTIRLQIEDKTFEYKDIKISFADDVPHGYQVASSTVSPTSLRVTGSRSAVEQTTVLYTNRISLSNHTGKFSAPVTISTLNSLISVDNDEKVFVTVDIKPIENKASYTAVPITFEYLKPELEIASGSDSTVSFTITGNMLDVENISLNHFLIRADCSGIAEPGEYELELSYEIPVNVVISDVSMDKVKIVVQNKSVDVPAETNAEALENKEVAVEKTEQ